jgi:hypothetical protein
LFSSSFLALSYFYISIFSSISLLLTAISADLSLC